eukprot:CAMPEP_0195307202 /NCGR_PEP_ID=MMETSP0707-20130614/37598_1 /TAXON_ID=33640 /ORGANISM="Asterionellopsis glacialis, Strain CCMP134" /LENGTH=318 /DNA_ID=CAMNT_0040371449 /DNA_START=114 /DNA_END=1071 /DNA_ORIENTATION=+
MATRNDDESLIARKEKDFQQRFDPVTEKTESCDDGRDDDGSDRFIPNALNDDQRTALNLTSSSSYCEEEVELGESTSAATTSLSTSPSSSIADLVYDAKVPITHFGLLIMLKPLTEDNVVTFDGYAKLPNGQEGPAETEEVFKNRGDVVIAINDCQIQGRKTSYVFNLSTDTYLKGILAINDCQIQGRKTSYVFNLINRYVSKRDTSNKESMFITFKMMDASLMTSKPTEADSSYIATHSLESQSLKLSTLKTKFEPTSLTAPPIEFSTFRDQFRAFMDSIDQHIEYASQMEEYAKEREFDHTNKNEPNKKRFGVFHF